MRRCLTILILLALHGGAAAQLAAGTWVKRGDQHGTLLTIEPAGGGYRLTYRFVGPKGEVLAPTMTLETMLDGKEARVLLDGKPTEETMKILRVDARHTTATIELNGKPFMTSKSELSADGRQLRVENDTSNGKVLEVWDRK